MSTVIEQLYQGLLADPAAAPSLQRRVFIFAKQRKAMTLLTTLAAHPALVPDLDRELSKFNDARVKGAWALRPNRTSEELENVARTDSRASVIVELAGRQDLSDEAYRQMARRGHQKVDWVLLGNPRVSLEVRQDVARRLGRTLTSDSYRTRGKASAALDDQPELHDAFASEASNPLVFSVVAGTPGLTVETQVRIAEAIVATASRAHANHLAQEAAAAAAKKAGQRHFYPSYGREYNDLHVLADVLEKLTSNPDYALETATILRGLEGLHCGHYQFDPKVALVLSRSPSGSGGSGGHNPLTEARTSSSREVLLKHAQDARTRQDAALATAVASNPASDVEVVAVVASIVPTQAYERILRTRRGETDVIVALLSRVHLYYLNDDMLVSTGEPERVLQELARLFAKEDRPFPRNMLSSRFVTPRLAENLPVSTLSLSDAPVQVRQATTAAIEAAFGGSVQHWEIFETLGDSFSGTLRELLDGVIAIAGDVDPSLMVTEEVPSAPLEESAEVLLDETPVQLEEEAPASASVEKAASENSTSDVCTTRRRGHPARRVQPAVSGEQLVIPV